MTNSTDMKEMKAMIARLEEDLASVEAEYLNVQNRDLANDLKGQRRVLKSTIAIMKHRVSENEVAEEVVEAAPEVEEENTGETKFTYYGREYEIDFNKETQTGTIIWQEGMYHEFRSFYLLNDTVLFKSRGKMANSVAKKMSKTKEQALLKKIKEICY